MHLSAVGAPANVRKNHYSPADPVNDSGHMTGGHLILLPLAARFFLLARISSHPVAPIAESYHYHHRHHLVADVLNSLS
ncbi:hypothetical protein BO83DRAFT_231341 [Aspergillus eucalypticola CBS 122712]|uniref:Uncharacterized protein n=1 Tax=Aspergillus eucalypticola (strain CBS 122712 / IBT 29274) TaxID=1448314 RepID=A0A317UJX4_ASPEC|nr:uncharacterized protein BO83DRAFT_28532 [Aspergillus eucalypticola CBS 122712]XP_025381763.1 uncharacterized protein BO83DRAFT_231341 [Aspergillus eucalypticola CBS 122712]PWY61428.1 hypothetical protein BO83DRAFT_28532 [Aspergillus eucalypticola CBS 122712]PWY61662.1 hypothetical protein BO83DRAFT_231341 [Aspergillus eucalypticola CBS 122712]